MRCCLDLFDSGAVSFFGIKSSLSFGKCLSVAHFYCFLFSFYVHFCSNISNLFLYIRVCKSILLYDAQVLMRDENVDDCAKYNNRWYLVHCLFVTFHIFLYTRIWLSSETEANVWRYFNRDLFTVQPVKQHSWSLVYRQAPGVLQKLLRHFADAFCWSYAADWNMSGYFATQDLNRKILSGGEILKTAFCNIITIFTPIWDSSTYSTTPPLPRYIFEEENCVSSKFCLVLERTFFF